MKIPTKHVQEITQKADNSWKKSMENKAPGFEDMMFQMMSMMNVELDENISLENEMNKHTATTEMESLRLNSENNLLTLQENNHNKELEIHQKEGSVDRKIDKQNPFSGESNEQFHDVIPHKTEKIIPEIWAKEEVPNAKVESDSRNIHPINQQVHKESSGDMNLHISEIKLQKDRKIVIEDVTTNRTIKEMKENFFTEERDKPIKNNKIMSIGSEIAMKEKPELEPLNTRMDFNTNQDKTTDQRIEMVKEDLTFKKTEDMDISRENSSSKEFDLYPQAINSTLMQAMERGEGKIEEVQIKNMDELVYDMVNEIKTLKEGEKSSLNMKLKPKELGEIEIRLEIKAGQVVGKILVEDMAIKGALESQLQNLKDNLNNQDIHLKDLEITLQQNPQEQSENQEKENNFFNQGERSTNRFLKQEGEEEIADSSNVYQNPIGNPYYSRQSSSLNFLA